MRSSTARLYDLTLLAAAVGFGVGIAIARVDVGDLLKCRRPDQTPVTISLLGLPQYQAWAFLVGVTLAFAVGAAPWIVSLIGSWTEVPRWTTLVRRAAALGIVVFGAICAYYWLGLGTPSFISDHRIRVLLIQGVLLSVYLAALAVLCEVEWRYRDPSKHFTSLEELEALLDAKMVVERISLILAVALALAVLATGALRAVAQECDPSANPLGTTNLLLWGGIYSIALVLTVLPARAIVQVRLTEFAAHLHPLDAEVSPADIAGRLEGRQKTAAHLGLGATLSSQVQAMLLAGLPLLSSLAGIFASGN
jgi:hypothetical protein